MTQQDQTTDAFEQVYGSNPTAVVKAPGIANLIGGHTDYNDGYTLPININRYTVIALKAREDGQVRLRSLQMDEDIEFDLNDFERSDGHWGDYVKAVAWMLGQEGYALRGWEGVVGSSIPMGAGLGSSAALLVATARAFAEVSGFQFDPLAMAKLTHRAEREWIGLHGGISDVLSVTLGRAGEAMLIDMQDMTVQHIPFPKTAGVVIMDTGVRADASDLEAIVQQRLQENQVAVRSYKVSSLRDLSMSRFEKDADNLDDPVMHRARHIMTENGRTILAAEMMRSKALAIIGKLMNDSHASLIEDYDVHSQEIEQIVECATKQANVYGARGTGYSIGGAAVALTRDFSADTISTLVATCYKKSTGNECQTFVAETADGVQIV